MAQEVAAAGLDIYMHTITAEDTAKTRWWCVQIMSSGAILAWLRPRAKPDARFQYPGTEPLECASPRREGDVGGEFDSPKLSTAVARPWGIAGDQDGRVARPREAGDLRWRGS